MQFTDCTKKNLQTHQTIILKGIVIQLWGPEVFKHQSEETERGRGKRGKRLESQRKQRQMQSVRNTSNATPKKPYADQ